MKVLLIIDMQIGIFGPNSSNIPNAEQLLHNTNRLIEKAQHTNTPVIVVQHHSSKGGLLEFGSDNWKIHPQLNLNSQRYLYTRIKGAHFMAQFYTKSLPIEGLQTL